MALIIMDSLFGNTATVAEAVAQGIGCGTSIVHVAKPGSAREVLRALDTHAADLLVIGGPTMNRGVSPRLAATLDALEGRLVGLQVAVFDTRLRGPRALVGSAARQVVRRMRASGAYPLVPPEGFYVRRVAPSPGARPRPEDVELIEGEMSRARVWGAQLAHAVEMARAA